MNRYVEIKEYYNSIIKDSELSENYIIRKLTILALTDSLAQEYYNYKGTNSSIFENFVMKMVKKYNYLKEIDIVSLYYDNKILFDSNNLTLNFLEDSYEYSPNQIINESHYTLMINFAKRKGIKINKYSYINLIYKYRSKIVHEFRLLGSNFKSMQKYNDITYLSYGFNNKTRWEINIPYQFLKNILDECLENFLLDRLKNNQDPFVNSKSYLNWYE